MLSKISQVISNSAPIPSQYYHHCILQNNPKNQKKPSPQMKEKKNYRTLPSSFYPRPFAYFLSFFFSYRSTLLFSPIPFIQFIPISPKSRKILNSPLFPILPLY